MEAPVAEICYARKETAVTQPAPLVEILRGHFIESCHAGHAVVANAAGEVLEYWGDPEEIILPRSSAKILQALPLLESGAGAHLSDMQLALACASHSGETRHVTQVSAWLEALGLSRDALICGPQASRDKDLRHAMIRNGEEPSRVHNNCSGKHTGFLTLAQHLGADLDYVDPDHPVQKAVRSAFEETCDETSPGFGIDGCSAPNFAVSLRGLARGMAQFAAAGMGHGLRDKAMAQLRDAMMAHPKLVSGEGRACAILMEAAAGKAAVKTGAEGVFVAILPEQKLGIALKIADGATRAAEVAIAALLARLGVIASNHPMLQRPIRNWDGLVTGVERPVANLAHLSGV
jgi:L-asparaginase II